AVVRVYVTGGQLWFVRQPVHFFFLNEQVEAVQPSKGSRRVRAVQVGIDALRLELVDPLLSPRPELGDRPELNRVGGARFRARGLEPHFEPVVAQRALLRRARHRVDVDDAERAGGDAGSTAIAD